MVAEEDGRIVGAILCGHDGRRGCLYHVCVDEGYRMRGIGKAMVVAAMEALTLVSRLVARRAAVLVEAGRQHDGIFRLGQLLTTADSVRGAAGGGTGELLYLYRAGGETTLTTRDSAAVFVAGEFRDTLLRRVGHMQLLRCDAAADTLEIDVGGPYAETPRAAARMGKLRTKNR